jgi:hypothetical protein
VQSDASAADEDLSSGVTFGALRQPAPAASEAGSPRVRKTLEVSTGETEPAEGSPTPVAEKPLVPIPDSLESGPVEVEAASFKGVTPGVTTMEQVDKAWGAPKEIR